MGGNGGAGAGGGGGAARTVTASGVTYTVEPVKFGHTLVTVSTAKLDAAWSKDSAYYIPPGGGGAQIGDRRDRFATFLASTTKPIIAPVVTLTSGGKIAFENGRHRFSVLRDQGKQKVVVSVPNGAAGRLRRSLGP